jgi:hypothetical protein
LLLIILINLKKNINIFFSSKDDKGNTPLHLIAALAREQKQWRHVFYKYCYGEGDIYGLNKRKLIVNDIYRGNFGEVINPL